MKKTYILLGIFVMLMGIYSCTDQITPVDDKTKIAQLIGLVAEVINNNQVLVKGAEVSLFGDGINLKDTTDISGNYSFSVRLDTTKNITYRVKKDGYITKIAQANISPGTTIIRDFEIQVDTTIIIGTVSGNPQSIAYIGPQTIELSVYGVGGEESKLVTYEVRDSLGNSIKSAGKDTITFSINGIPVQGGAYVSPVYGIISPAGKAVTTVNSGTTSGVLQLVATIRRKSDGRIISSSPVKVVINAGLPNQNHFTISAEKFNFPALHWSGRENMIGVQAGDKYSNPVQKGTAIYFNTTAGIISAARFTNETGQVSTTLFSGNPNPVPSANGYAWVRAFTLGENGVNVADSVRLVFTGRPRVIVSPDSVEVLRSSSQDLSIVISDENGNPLCAGTSVTSTIEYTKPEGTNWSAIISGLPTESFGDYLEAGTNKTHYTLRITDATPQGGTPEKMPVIIKVTVSGDNGKLTKMIYGTVGSKTITGGGTSGFPYNIVYNGPTTIPLSVSGVGGIESQLVSYEVRDSVGNPITLDKKDTVVFTITGPTSMGGTRVSPVFAITDANGRATTTIHSGTISGVFQLVASLRRDDNGVLIQSTPVKIIVRAGFPSQQHFSIWPSKYNFPALYKFGETMSIFAKLGDRYSNPVEPGTAVYFNTTGGIIGGDAYTNNSGDASVILQSANPYPVGGYAWVKAQTLGEGGALVQDSIRILFSGNSSITSVTDSFRVERESYQEIPITISDQNGNPLAAGTIVSTLVEFTPPAGVPNASVSVTGLPTSAFGDYLTGGPNRTNFTMRISDATPNGTTDRMNVRVTVKIEGPNGTTFKNFFGTVGTKVTGGDPLTAFPHSIAYVGPATINLNVAGVGGTESATITYEVRDSLGTPITWERRDTVTFALIGTPTIGGAYISPTFAMTNAAGRVSTTINSGIKSGVLQLVATLRRESDGAIVTSTPVKVVINAGLPDQNYFSIAPAQTNFAAYNWVGRTNQITIQAGDKYSNPVQQGTAIYFNTTGGIIQAAGYTNAAGQATNTLYSGNPLPNDPTPGFGPGYAWITAFTLGENGVEIKDSVRVLFSGRTYITVNPTSFAVPQGGSIIIDVNISDQHGNPLAPGTIITPTIEFTPPTGMSWSAKIAGLPTDPLDDYLIRGTGRTDFELQVIDGTPGGTPQVMNVVVKIVVTGTNGTATKFIYGSVGN